MNKGRFCIDWKWGMWVLATVLGVGFFLVSNLGTRAQNGGPTVGTSPPPNFIKPQIDVQHELKMKINGPFTVIAAGDLNYRHPVAQLIDPSVQAAIKIVRDGDIAVANLEQDTVSTGDDRKDQATADDIKAMGFRILNRADNFNPVPGLLRVNKLLEDRGIMWAGVGENLEEARAPQYLDSPKGRIALVGMVSSSEAGESTYAAGPKSPGADVLHLATYQIVTPDELEMLRKIRDDAYSRRLEYEYPVPPIPADEPKDRLQLSRIGQWFKSGDKPGTLSFTMNPGDEREILRSIRNGKENSDFLIALIHSHEDRSPLIVLSTSEYPPDFLVELAHKTIDNGADMFVGTGVHMLHGVEIYKGKPIFYDLHSFTYELFRDVNAPPSTTEVTGFELQANTWASPSFPRLNNEGGMQSVLAECKYDKGQLQEVILHPIDLGFGAPMANWGIPHVPSPEVAQKILQRMQRLSKPFGTTISIEGNLGVIHVNAAQVN